MINLGFFLRFVCESGPWIDAENSVCVASKQQLLLLQFKKAF